MLTGVVSSRNLEKSSSSSSVSRSSFRIKGCALILDDGVPRLSLCLLNDRWLLVNLQPLYWHGNPRRDGLRLLPPLLFFPLRLPLLFSREIGLLLGRLLLVSCDSVLRLDGLSLPLSVVLSLFRGLLLLGKCLSLSACSCGEDRGGVRRLPRGLNHYGGGLLLSLCGWFGAG